MSQLPRERWRQLDDIFEAVAGLPAAERAAYLDRVCAGDPQLRAEAESLYALAPGPHLLSRFDKPAFGCNIAPGQVTRDANRDAWTSVEVRLNRFRQI